MNSLRTDHCKFLEKYDAHAANYDQSAAFTMPLRLRTIGLLQLQPGNVVLDVGAGTGLSYAPLLDAVGPRGRVLAFEPSGAMLAQAKARCEREHWRNVWQVQADAATVQLPELADAVLFNYTQDVVRCPESVANVLRQCKPGARVAMAGMKFFPWWTGPLNLLAWAKNRPYCARAADMWAPWDIVANHCTGFQVTSTQWGMGFMASGALREGAVAQPAA